MDKTPGDTPEERASYWVGIINEGRQYPFGVTHKPDGKQHNRGASSSRRPELDFIQASITDSARAAPVASNDSKVEVVLPCGTVLRITATCPPQYLLSVVTALENR